MAEPHSSAFFHGEYLGDLMPILAGHTTALAALIIVVLGLLQWRGIRWGSVFQNATSAITSCVFMVLIVAAFAHPHYRASTLTPIAVMPAGIAFLAAWVLVLQAVIGTYDGWYAALSFGDEIVNPGVELPRSFIGGVLLLTAIYVLINAALLYSLDMTRLAGENLPLGRLAQIVSGARGAIVFRWLMTLILISSANAAVLAATRVLFAMIRDGWGPSRLGP